LIDSIQGKQLNYICSLLSFKTSTVVPYEVSGPFGVSVKLPCLYRRMSHVIFKMVNTVEDGKIFSTIFPKLLTLLPLIKSGDLAVVATMKF